MRQYKTFAEAWAAKYGQLPNGQYTTFWQAYLAIHPDSPYTPGSPAALAAAAEAEAASQQGRRWGWVSIRELTALADKHGKLVFRHLDGNREVNCHLGDGPAVVTDGYGGWEQKPRPRRKPLTEWVGGKVWTMTMPILLSGWFHDSSVESRVRRLEQMARADQGDDEPMPVRIVLPGDSPRDNHYIWVIDGIEWGASRRRDKDGHRTYQEGTVTLTEYVRPDVIKLSPSKARRSAKKKAPKKKAARRRGSKHFVG